MRVTVTSIIIGASGTVGKEAGRVGNWRTNRDHPNYRTVEISQNTEKRPGDLLSFSIRWENIR